MKRRWFSLAVLALAAAFATGCSTAPREQAEAGPQYPNHPDFKPAPEQGPLPDSVLVVKRTPIEKAKYPAIDFHFHGRRMQTAEEYEAMIAKMDQAGVGVICNMDGGFSETFDKNMELSKPYKDRFLQFARIDWEGINEPGWSEKAAAELDRCFRAGAAGLKISKRLGLEVQNADGTYVQCDDPRLDAVWETCARNNKPVMIHVSDSVARFQPIGLANERWEAGQWRSDVDGNYYGTNRPGIEEIFAHREKMFAKHPNTRFVNAHIAMMAFDLKRVGEMLDKFPNTDVEVSARIQDLGRQPFSGREFLLKYQDRVLFGSDGNPSREVGRFWTPHWRYFETNDEYFDHPAQMLSPLGAPLQGRWAIHGAYLPDEAIRKIYYQNALKYLPALGETFGR